jgi:hypothetical protein
MVEQLVGKLVIHLAVLKVELMGMTMVLLMVASMVDWMDCTLVGKKVEHLAFQMVE